MSSGKSLTLDLTCSGRSFMYTRKRIEPRREPWGNMSGIFGWELGWNGRLAPESCKSCNDFWARDFKLMGVFGLKTDWNWSF